MNIFLLFLKSFTDLFVSGRSFSKVFFLIVFGLVFGLIYSCRKKEPSSKFTWLRITVILFCITFILGLSTHIGVILNTGHQIGDSVLYLSQEEISSSVITHTHEMKSVFGMFMQSQIDSLDYGAASVDFVPNTVSVIGIFLLFGLLISYAVSLWKNELGNIRKVIFVSLLYFILLKNSFDGGLINHEVIAVGLFASVWLLVRKKNFVYFLPLISIVIFFSIFSFYAFHILVTLVFILCTYFIIFNFSLRRKVFSVFVIFLLVVMNFVDTFIYNSLKPVDNDSMYVVSLYGSNTEVLYSVGRLNINMIKDYKVEDVIKEYDLVSNHRPVSIEWKTCIPNTYKTITFNLYTKSKIKNTELKKDHWYNLVIENDKGFMYKGNLVLYACTSQKLENQLQEGLRELNALPAIISDVSVEKHKFDLE